MARTWVGVAMAWPDETGALDATYDHTLKTGHNDFDLTYGPTVTCVYDNCDFQWQKQKSE